MNNAKLKEQAKTRLSGNWQVLVLSLLLFILLGGCCGFIAEVMGVSWLSSVFTLLVEALIAMGFVGMILNVARKKKIKFEDLFDQTHLFGKYIVITLALGLISLILWAMEFLSFNSLLVVLQHQVEVSTVLAVILVVFGLFLSAAIIMVDIYITISLSQSLFILYDEPKLSIGKVLMKSFDMMADYILEYFILVLSFIGWAILGLFTLGILYLWLVPYFAVTIGLFYDKIKKEYEATTGDFEALEANDMKVTVAPVKKAQPKKTSAAKKTTTKKTTATKPAAKKPATKTAATTKKAPVKKATTTAKKAAPRKTTKPKTTK